MSTANAMTIDGFNARVEGDFTTDQTSVEQITSSGSLTITGTLINIDDGSVQNDGSIITNAIQNEASIAGNGTLKVNSGTNSNVISQSVITVADSGDASQFFTNTLDGTMTADSFLVEENGKFVNNGTLTDGFF